MPRSLRAGAEGLDERGGVAVHGEGDAVRKRSDDGRGGRGLAAPRETQDEESREKIASLSVVGSRSPPAERFVLTSTASSFSDSNSTANASGPVRTVFTTLSPLPSVVRPARP